MRIFIRASVPGKPKVASEPTVGSTTASVVQKAVWPRWVATASKRVDGSAWISTAWRMSRLMRYLSYDLILFVKYI